MDASAHHPSPLPTTVLVPKRNLRDLGGYTTAEGTRVRTGVVYRSAHLHDLDGPDRELLDRLAIRTVCDLRSRHEAAVRPGPFQADPTVSVHTFDMLGTRATGDPVQTILEYGITEVSARDLATFYRRFIDDHATAYGQVVGLCSRPEQHAVLIHCSAGKDRTGVAAALVLAALGVPDETIVHDYQITNESWSPHQIERAERALADAGVDLEPLVTYFLAPAETMISTLHYIRERYGSVEGYLLGPAGLAPAALDSLREHLLE